MTDESASTNKWLRVDAGTLLNTYALLVVFTVLFSGETTNGYVFPLFLHGGELPPVTTPLLVVNFLIGMYLLFPLGRAVTITLRRTTEVCDGGHHSIDWRAATLVGLPVLPAAPDLIGALHGVTAAAPGVEGVATTAGVVLYATGWIITRPLILAVDAVGASLGTGTAAALAVTIGAGFWYVTLVVLFDEVPGR